MCCQTGKKLFTLFAERVVDGFLTTKLSFNSDTDVFSIPKFSFMSLLPI